MLRVGFFGQSGPYAPVALRHLLAQAKDFHVTVVVEGRKLPIARSPHRWLRPKPAPLPVSESLADLALAAGIDVLQTCDVNASYVALELGKRNLDCIVCVGFDRLFTPPLLDVARLAVNAHPSALPTWRGPAPLFWMLRDGLREGHRDTAVTLHALDKYEDHGPVYGQQALRLPPLATGEEIYGLAGLVAADLFIDMMARWQRGDLRAVPQDHSRATRAPRPKPEDAYVTPAAWSCHHLIDFACGAPYFQTPWLRMGDDVFFLRRGIRAELGRKLPADYILYGSNLVVQCRDGVAVLDVQV